MRSLLFLLVALCLSCTTISKVTPDFVISDEDRAFQSLTNQVATGKFAEAVVKADEFQQNYPYSLKLQKARFEKAQALEGLEKWNDAADTYTAISNFSKKSQPEIAAQSVYRLSFVYEALNDNQRVLTSLFEAQRWAEYLPAEVGMAEIPARLAMAYTKENNSDEARRWLDEADHGLTQVLESRTEAMTNEWLARTYYNMGSVSTSQLTAENAAAVIQGQRAIQKYLIKSLQYNDPVWSAKAATRLRLTFSNLWTVLDQQPETPGSEPAVALKLKKDQQFKLAGPFAELVDQALLFQPAPDQSSNPYQSEVFSYLRELKVKIAGVLQDPIYTPLIRRSDKASPKHSVPAKLDKSQDPN